jgi:hypothetical protein
MMECRLSAPSTLTIFPLPNVIVLEQPFAVFRKRDGLKCVGRFLSLAGSGSSNLTDHDFRNSRGGGWGVAGNPLAGAAGATFNQVAGVIGNDVPEFRLISRRGAFDLERKLNRDLRNIPRISELLGSILTRTEIAALAHVYFFGCKLLKAYEPFWLLVTT